MTCSYALAIACFCGLACRAGAARADCPDSRVEEVSGVPLNEGGVEKHSSGWAMYIDNDVLLPINRDKDYTGGFAATVAGRRAQQWPVSIDRPLELLDQVSHVSGDRCDGGHTLHSLQVGTVAFTPSFIQSTRIRIGDRPYASLIYLANGRLYVGSHDDAVWHTNLTVGFLGLNVVGYSQNLVHEPLGMHQAKGWNRQISDGGEPTFRYAIARQARMVSVSGGGGDFELSHSVAGSIGYLTEASAALSMRWGRISTPWWSFSPDRVTYMAEPLSVIGAGDGHGGPRELYAWGGIKLHARAYNAFLQGQFRDNDIDYSYGDTRPLVGEAWLGVTSQVSASLRLSWALRYMSSELRQGRGDREIIWGSLMLSRDL